VLGETGLVGGSRQGELRLDQGHEDWRVGEVALAAGPSELGQRTRANSDKT
jgi:hypothetical protein